MKNALSLFDVPFWPPTRLLAVSALAWSAALLAASPSAAQEVQPKEVAMDGYSVHQSIELGGHVRDGSGSNAMYDTLVNLQSGPRILSYSLSMRSLGGAVKTPFFDDLTSSSFGYGGDPNGVSTLRFSKGRLYDFNGMFRRDRQYFDYDLLDNTLISPAATVYAPQLQSPHLFNTVRRMTDVTLTLFPLSQFHLRAGYSSNVSEGPSFSTVHTGGEGLLAQYWRNSTDSWVGGIDWNPVPRTMFSFDEFVVHYKGDTTWRLTGLDFQLADGTPVSYGIDYPYNNGACANPNAGGTGNPKCNAYLQYTRSAPTRSLFPTEQFRFSSSSLKNLEFSGRIAYTGANSNLTNFNELFNGLVTRTSTREETDTGFAHNKRVNTAADFGITWQALPRLAFSDQFDFVFYRDSAVNQITDTTYAGASLLAPPGPPVTTVTPDTQYLNQKTRTNTFTIALEATPRARLSVGHRYRVRVITNAGGDVIPIDEQWGLFDASLRPVDALRVNAAVEVMYADNAFTRISPRQLQHYKVRGTYKAGEWLTLSGAANIFESRDNVDTVHHLEHSRDFSFGASVARSERYSLDLNYAHDNVFSRTDVCYVSSAAGEGTPGGFCADPNSPAYPGPGYFLGNANYSAPTQSGSVSVMLAPVKKVRANVGYRINDVSGAAEALNPRQVPGSLQSRYQTPFGDVAFNLLPGWTWKAAWNHYRYGEGDAPVGPTAPRDFRSEVYTFSVRYAF